jgi:hypothetical protein
MGKTLEKTGNVAAREGICDVESAFYVNCLYRYMGLQHEAVDSAQDIVCMSTSRTAFVDNCDHTSIVGTH